MQEMIQMGNPNQYEECYDWLDKYNADQTQPPEQPTAQELQMRFPELGNFEAIQIMASWAERVEKQLKGG